MKKLILSLMLMLCAAFTLTAIGCGGGTSSSSELTYTVTLDANGGTFTDGSSMTISVNAGETVSITETPTKSGYRFAYWALNGTEYDLSGAVLSDITLTAVYTELSGHTLTFTQTDGIQYDTALVSGSTVTEGETVTFGVNVSAFYTGTPMVLANGKVLKETDGIYSLVVEEDTTVTVSGVRQAFSAMTGSGTMSDAFLVTEPVDLLYIAKQVNAGVSKYTLGYYVLGNDIDLKGEELDIIGDASTESSFFGGCFYGQGYTISNFVIDATDKNYVGLFGWVMVNPGTTSSGLIRELNISDYEVTASADDFDVNSGDMRTLAVGSLIGYSIGAQVQLCSAKNGEVNIYADKDYFSYTGGLIGYQQSTYYNGAAYSSSVLYSYIENTEINASEGLVLYAGGISGYLLTASPFAPSYILNSYTTGSVKGETRTGGIAGGIGQYCSVANCYSTATISARSTFNDLGIYGEYCTASAGGLVGYAANDSVVSNSFATGTLSAHATVSGSKYAVVGDAVANGDDANAVSVDSMPYVVYNCLYVKNGVSGEQDLTNKTYIQTHLQWKDIDWIFSEDGSYPVINYEEPDSDADPSTCKLTVKMLGNETVQSLSSVSHTLSDYYYSFSDLYQDAILDLFATADSGKISYGYFFDEACTMRVPYGYIVTTDVTLYLPFADYSEVSGTYYIVPENVENASKLVLYADSTYVFEDGCSSYQGNYVYNGKYILFENARFARFYASTSTKTDEYGNVLHELDKYGYFYFKGVLENGVLSIFDEDYFTQASPLQAISDYGIQGEYFLNDAEYTFYVNYTGKTKNLSFTYTIEGTKLTLTLQDKTTLEGTIENGVITLNNSALHEYDQLKGVWEKGAAFNRNYTFDGKGGWSFEAFGYIYGTNSKAEKTVLSSAQGSYEWINEAQVQLSNGLIATLEDGVLTINGQDYYAHSSFVGEWKDFTNNVLLTLYGITDNGVGQGKIEFPLNDEVYKLTYEKETSNSSKILLYADGIIFGSIEFDENMDLLNASLYNSASASIVDGYQFVHYDKYSGEWVSNYELFEIVDFNGLGNYKLSYPLEDGSLSLISGILNINGYYTAYELTNDGYLNGTFVCEGVTYAFSYDEDTQKVIITFQGGSAELERKDQFSAFDFIDADNVIYDFDGKGNLTAGGTLLVKNGDAESKYGYKVTENGADVYDLNNQKVAEVYLNTNQTAYVFKTLSDGTETTLYLDHIFRGQWAINGEYGLLVIGAMDLNNTIKGTILGKYVEFTYVDSSLITYKQSSLLRYIYSAKNNEGKTVLAMSDTEVITSDYVICTEIDKMYGTWTGKTENVGQSGTITRSYSIQFDGATDRQSTYGNAIVSVKTYRNGLFNSASEVSYSYRIDENGTVIMWSEDVGTFRLDFASSEDGYDGSYTLNGLSFIRIQVDGLYSLVAKDANGVQYTFDGEGNVTASDGTKYTYKITSYTTGRYELVLTTEDGATYAAILDTSLSSNITIEITPLENAV